MRPIACHIRQNFAGPVYLPPVNNCNSESGTGPLSSSVRLGRYELFEHIGGDHLLDVFLAHQQGMAGFEKLVVFSRVSASADAAAIADFQESTAAAALMRHPNITHVLDAGEEQGQFYSAVELVDGLTLHRLAARTWRAGRSIPMELACCAIVDAAAALDYAHHMQSPEGSKPLVHGAVSPRSLIVTKGGITVVAGFGAMAAGQRVRHHGPFDPAKNALSFAAPEQLLGDVNHLSDIYSLGATLFWLLTGRRPVLGNTEAQLLSAMVTRTPPSPRSLNPQVPRGLDDLVQRMMAKDPAQRPTSAQVIVDELAFVLGERGLLPPAIAEALAFHRDPSDERPAAPPFAACTALSGLLSSWQGTEGADVDADAAVLVPPPLDGATEAVTSSLLADAVVPLMPAVSWTPTEALPALRPEDAALPVDADAERTAASAALSAQDTTEVSPAHLSADPAAVALPGTPSPSADGVPAPGETQGADNAAAEMSVAPVKGNEDAVTAATADALADAPQSLIDDADLVLLNGPSPEGEQNLAPTVVPSLLPLSAEGAPSSESAASAVVLGVVPVVPGPGHAALQLVPEGSPSTSPKNAQAGSKLSTPPPPSRVSWAAWVAIAAVLLIVVAIGYRQAKAPVPPRLPSASTVVPLAADPVLPKIVKSEAVVPDVAAGVVPDVAAGVVPEVAGGVVPEVAAAVVSEVAAAVVPDGAAAVVPAVGDAGTPQDSVVAAAEVKDDQPTIPTQKAVVPTNPDGTTKTITVRGPPRVAWYDHGRQLGKGNTTLTIPANIKFVVAFDLDRSVRTVMPLAPVLDYAALPRGTLAITASPAATVQVGQSGLGSTPLAPLDVVAGTYVVLLTHEGRIEKRTVVVKAGKTAEVAVDFAK